MGVSFIDYKVANVYGIYGHLGGGKTLSAVEIAVDFLRRGFVVVSNIQLFNIDRLRGEYVFVPDFSRQNFWDLPCGAPRGSSDPFRVAVIIDECAEFFDQYSSQSPFLKSFLSWLRHSSKRGQFVFLIVQKPEFIAKSLRLLINKWICCDDMGQLKFPCLPKFWFLNPFVCRRVFDRYGNKISSGLCLLRKSSIGQYYDTSQSIAVEGQVAKYNYTKQKSPDYFYLYFLLLLLYLLFISYYL